MYKVSVFHLYVKVLTFALTKMSEKWYTALVIHDCPIMIKVITVTRLQNMEWIDKYVLGNGIYFGMKIGLLMMNYLKMTHKQYKLNEM